MIYLHGETQREGMTPIDSTRASWLCERHHRVRDGKRHPFDILGDIDVRRALGVSRYPDGGVFRSAMAALLPTRAWPVAT
jgi:hypothetical protein